MKDGKSKSPPGKEHAGKEQERQFEFQRERTQFRALLLTNPNYFGNLKQSQFPPVVNIASNTTFEELGCVGFQPHFSDLEAVVYVKQPSGYGGDVCSNGTSEFVRFFLSFDGGANWIDQGLTSFQVYDIPGTNAADSRLEYAATLHINPPKRFCFRENLIRARAILSWNVPPPPDPDFVPVWGNVHDTHIPVEGFKLVLAKDLFEVLKVEVPPDVAQVLDPAAELKLGQPKSLSVKDLQERYREKRVPVHRFAMAELTQFLEQPTSTAGVATQGIQALFPGLEIKIDDILDQLFPKDGNTSFEELECIGLNTNTDALVGVIRVKLPSGYSGGPCTAGSTEYVTFWADFNNNGTFETCLGTASVKVHDFDSIPKEGLEYAVFLPIDLTHRRQPCSEGPRVVRIRAILSWNAAPPCFNPNYIPIWGNREETLVHITPGPTIPMGEVIPKISVLGGIPVGKIDNFTGLTTATAVFEANNLAPDSLGRPCPFGQWINVKGPQYFGYKYMVDVRELPSGAWTTLNTPLKVVDQDGNVNDQIPDGSGMFTYLPFTQNIGNLLALWLSTGDALWQVRLRIFELDGDPLPGADSHRIQLDNTWPDASVVIETGVGNCGKFNQGDPLAGRFVARDLYFGSYSLTVKPPINVPPIGVPVPSGAFVQTALPPGDPWSLDTSQLTPCGYIVEVVAVDRAILNSATVGHHTPGSAGFCIEKMT